MIKLSEIIRTDCYIDCGSNEKLREVVSLIPVKPDYTQVNGGIYTDDTMIRVMTSPPSYLTVDMPNESHPTIHISQIDLNG